MAHSGSHGESDEPPTTGAAVRETRVATGGSTEVDARTTGREPARDG